MINDKMSLSTNFKITVNMKNIFLSILMLSLANVISVQGQVTDDKSRFISVTGSSEVVVSPDEIELTIVLKEYEKTKKVSLEQIESQFLSILRKHHIDEQKLVFDNTGFYWYYWWSYRNKNYKQRKITIKLDSSTDFMALVKDLDYEGVSSLSISGSSNKKLQALRKEVKISALKAAKEKAIYLLESIGEKLGKVISIEEVPFSQNYYWRGNQNLLSNAVISTDSGSEDIGNVAKIKLRYEVKVKFEIK